MLKPFRQCGPSAALFSWAAGLIVFALTKYAFAAQIASLGSASAQSISVAAPIVASVIVYVVMGWIRPWHNMASHALVDSLDHDVTAESPVSVAADAS